MPELFPGIMRTVELRASILIGALILGPLVLGFSSSLSAAAEAGSAMESMKGTINQALKVLEDESLKSPEKSRERLEILEDIIGKRFDYREMGKRTLGKYWQQFSETDQEEFVRLFQRFLSETYAGNVDGYSGEQVQYIKERRKGDFAEVQTVVTSDKSTTSISYRLLKRSNTWKVYDVVIEGVSLVKNFRSQFGRIIEAESGKGLLEKLRMKTTGSKS
ncbi:MAG: ABC transporter substrate-binding protein [Nitrospira sp. SB0675_bin_23]|nr:ABC transporter substrate-binding protein [Nitrospira sp. SB0667_bin_9]MYD31590.1 ABC transporter substrate-binding protein [Nitrospira sp. SB0661_bin_20]MYH01610.1 ABC transporter substrate-binding protein [Nitrospira sp. SB0675_bin_23]MYJ23768.1 ABC transporter substrate-binding protein [Nitrospira sp. SB0673_bin_12]